MVHHFSSRIPTNVAFGSSALFDSFDPMCKIVHYDDKILIYGAPLCNSIFPDGISSRVCIT
jgi:hypothetical protein